MGLIPANIVIRKELHLLCDPLFSATLNEDWPIINNELDLLDWLHDIHNYNGQNLKHISDMTFQPILRATKREISVAASPNSQ